MSRRTARELAFKLLFQLEIQRDNMEEQIKLFFDNKDLIDKDLIDDDLTDNDKAYIFDVVEGTIKNVEKIDKSIEKYLKGWTISRISKVDLSILRLAIYEILNRDDIPPNVSINEAVEIAKKYNSEEAGAFVNGILGKIIKYRGADSQE